MSQYVKLTPYLHCRDFTLPGMPQELRDTDSKLAKYGSGKYFNEPEQLQPGGIDLKIFYFWCPGCEQCHPYTVGTHQDKDLHGPARWEFNGSILVPDFKPSLLCNRGTDRDCHLYIDNGIINYCDDQCWHEYKGRKNVAMLKIEPARFAQELKLANQHNFKYTKQCSGCKAEFPIQGINIVENLDQSFSYMCDACLDTGAAKGPQ